MTNNILKEKIAQDIDKKVERILRDLGNPEPPLQLEHVRELLKLDLGYYQLDDPTYLQETYSKLKIASKQVFKRPTLLLDAVKKWDLTALYIPDQKRILLDETQPTPKQRWNETHEIGHSILPWHEGAMLGDNTQTLSASCHDKMETEANFAAGQLLFLRSLFIEQAMSMPQTIASVKKLKPLFGNTYTTTFWRCVETWGHETPVMGIISKHPRKQRSEIDPAHPHKHFISSPRYHQQFSKTSATQLFPKISQYCNFYPAGPLGNAEIILRDDNGEEHIFEFESFSNSYDTITLGVYKKPAPQLVLI